MQEETCSCLRSRDRSAWLDWYSYVDLRSDRARMDVVPYLKDLDHLLADVQDQASLPVAQ